MPLQPLLAVWPQLPQPRVTAMTAIMNVDDRSYYGRNRGRSYGCDRGTGGTIIGGVVGGLAGHEVAGRRNRTEGAIIGVAIGALAGRAIDKSSGRRCR